MVLGSCAIAWHAQSCLCVGLCCVYADSVYMVVHLYVSIPIYNRSYVRCGGTYCVYVYEVMYTPNYMLTYIRRGSALILHPYTYNGVFGIVYSS